MAAATLYRIPQYKSTTLSGAIDISQTTGIALTAIPADVDITKPGIVCITYTNPINTDNAEWVTFTSINGSNELVGATRGAEGYSAKAHSNGATVGWVVSKSHLNEIYDLLDGTDTGATLNTPAITTPKITTSINDSGGNEVIKTPATASAVNEITVTNAATNDNPAISATGGDTNIGINLKPKGTGVIAVDGPENYAADAGSDDTYVITVEGISAYTTGQIFRFKANTVNTGAATLNVNSLGAKTIVKSYNVTLADGDIKANQLVEVIYDGTNMQLLSPVTAASASALSSKIITSTRDLTAATGNVAYTGVGFVPTSITAIMGATGTEPFSVGFADSAKTSYSLSGYGTADAKTVSAALFYIDVDAANNKQTATVATYDADGFTLTWTKTGTPTGTYTITFICYK